MVHVTLIGAGVFFAYHSSPPVQLVHAITLVAAAPPTSNAAKPKVDESPPVKSDKTAPILKNKTPEKPKPEVKTPPNTEKAPPRPTNTEVKPLASEISRGGQDVKNLTIPGLQGRFPDYERRIWNIIATEWGEDHPPLTTDVTFTILRDGSVAPEITTVRSSGRPTYDSEARSTIEKIGREKRFGALPDSTMGRLSVTVRFTPRVP